MALKELRYDVFILSVEGKMQAKTPIVYTNDLNSANFVFNIKDLTDLTGMEAKLLFYMLDGSFFQVENTAEEPNKVSISGTAVTYTLEEHIGDHVGISEVQLVLVKGPEINYASQLFKFDVRSGLEKKVNVEVMIQDWGTLTTEARAFLTEFEETVASAKTQVDENIVEAAVAEKYAGLEAQYATDLSTNKQSVLSLTEQLHQTEQELSSQLAQTNDFMVGGKSFPVVVEHPFANNPVLTKDSVTDRTAQGVADPFICVEKGVYHMFFEVISTLGGEEIGHAYSYDGFNWTYTQVVISEAGQHFAYPFVMKHNGKWYMIPDKGNTLDVYEATNFPYEWQNVKTLLSSGVDATPFQFKGVWYMHAKQGSVVNLFVCNGDWLTGTWSKHPASPILSGAYDRGAGRAIVHDDSVVLPMQGFISSYGEYAQWFRLYNLTPTTANIAGGKRFMGRQSHNWYANGMHHIDHVEGNGLELLVVDGINRTTSNNWAIGIYTQGEENSIRVKTSNRGHIYLTDVGTWKELSYGAPDGTTVYDTWMMWDRVNKVINIPMNGFYRVMLQVTDQGGTGTRQLGLSVFDKTKNVVVAEKHEIITSRKQVDLNTITLDTVVYLEKGSNLAPRIKSDAATFLTDIPTTNFFEIEKTK